MENDLAPERILKNAIRYWWLLVLIMILGGVVGFLINTLRPPVFESKAEISTVIDFSLLSKLEDWEEDQIFESVGDVIRSTSVMEKVIDGAKNSGIQLSEPEYHANFETDRQDTRWVLRVRSSDPEKAQVLDSLWSKAAIEELAQLRVKSIASMTVQKSLDSLVACLKDKVVVDPSAALCPDQDVSQVKSKIAQIAQDPELQQVWSSLTLSHTSYELTTEATLPTVPVLFRRNINTLMGSLIGLILGIWLISSDLLEKRSKTG